MCCTSAIASRRCLWRCKFITPAPQNNAGDVYSHEDGGRPTGGLCMQGSYSMFIALLPYLDPLMFHLASQQNEHTQAVQGAEKTAFAWCALDGASIPA